MFLEVKLMRNIYSSIMANAWLNYIERFFKVQSIYIDLHEGDTPKTKTCVVTK